MTDCRRNIDRTGEIFNDCNHQGLDPFVFKSRTSDHRDKFIRTRSPADRLFKLLNRGLLFLKKHIAHFFIHVGNRFNQLIQTLLSHLLQFSRNFFNLVSRPQFLAVRINKGLLIDDIELALKLILFS